MRRQIFSHLLDKSVDVPAESLIACRVASPADRRCVIGTVVIMMAVMVMVAVTFAFKDDTYLRRQR